MLIISARIGNTVYAPGSTSLDESLQMYRSLSTATTLGVCPLTLLCPAAHAQTVCYNCKVCEGCGFTLAELNSAGIEKEALGVGIVVDHRRRNLSEEGKKLNVDQLEAYKAQIIVFPHKAGKVIHQCTFYLC